MRQALGPGPAKQVEWNHKHCMNVCTCSSSNGIVCQRYAEHPQTSIKITMSKDVHNLKHMQVAQHELQANLAVGNQPERRMQRQRA